MRVATGQFSVPTDDSLRDAAQIGEDAVSALRALHDVNATGFMIDAMCSRWLEVLVGITVDVR